MSENNKSPNIIKTLRDENDRVIGYIAGDSVDGSPENVRGRLDNIARIWRRALDEEKTISKREDDI